MNLDAIKRAALWALGFIFAGCVVGGILGQFGILDDSRRDPLINALVSIGGIIFVVVLASGLYKK
jgi:hypothetical protein